LNEEFGKIVLPPQAVIRSAMATGMVAATRRGSPSTLQRFWPRYSGSGRRQTPEDYSADSMLVAADQNEHLQVLESRSWMSVSSRQTIGYAREIG